MNASLSTSHSTAKTHGTHGNPATDALTIRITWAELTEQRSYLVRYAQRRIVDAALAEDLVHDVFEAVMSGRASFAGRSALRSWLVAILKHKIVDLARERHAHYSLEAMQDIDDEHTPLALVSAAAGPQELTEQRQQLQHVLARIQALPEGLRRAIELRVLQDGSSEEVCQALAISEDNLFVRLHRARKQLLN
jgi:RNA polymerase sigma-70 factor, ECF subfamily